ncbi:MAG TPA: hypothetical protein VGF24_07425 [Vicinamibacterales bacterium]
MNNRVDNKLHGASWRIIAVADGVAPEPFYWLSLIAARTVAPPQPHRRRLAECAAAHRAGLGLPGVGDLFAA